MLFLIVLEKLHIHSTVLSLSTRGHRCPLWTVSDMSPYMETEHTQTHTAGLLGHMLRHLCGVA